MAKADSFMKKFSLRRLKMGTIIEFLTKLDMTDSRAKFVKALKTLQVIYRTKNLCEKLVDSMLQCRKYG